MPIKENHLNYFIETLETFKPQTNVGFAPKKFVDEVINKIDQKLPESIMVIFESLPLVPIDRRQLKQICEEPKYSITYKIICVMAWGAMGVGPAIKKE